MQDLVDLESGISDFGLLRAFGASETTISHSDVARVVVVVVGHCARASGVNSIHNLTIAFSTLLGLPSPVICQHALPHVCDNSASMR